ncbi:MAG TPA: RNA-binding protein [Thermoanaerobaculia bacterium]|jgi:RNA recognition motif-containing protein
MTKIYVGNLPKRINDAQLRTLATPYGKPNAANVAREVKSGLSKGYGFIEYATADEARAAIAGLDGKEVHGQKLTAFEASALNIRSWSAAG